MKNRIILFLSFIFAIIFSPFLNAQITDAGWPKTFSQDGDQIIIYQPQVDEWKNSILLTAKIAVQVIPNGDTQPMTGVVWLKGDTVVNQDDRVVFIHNIEITKSAFNEQDPTKEQLAEDLAKKLIPTKAVSISLDRMLAQMDKMKSQVAQVPVNNNPPQIFVSQSPAKLVLFDGDPLWNEIQNTDLTFAVNTNWNIFFQTTTKKYFLLDDGHWLMSQDLKSWTAADTLPENFNKLPNDDNWKDVLQALPLKPYGNTQIPTIFLSTQPAELIVINGQPQLRNIPGTQLSVVENTQSDLFFYDADKNYYYLVAGRWFNSSSLSGPWAFASSNLPADFSKIPVTDPKGQVLASIPGTSAADSAVREAQIPQLATVKKDEVSLNVVYSGKPEFKSIPGTSLEYAVNTQTIVIKVKNQYYALSNAIWFTSSSPARPWVVAEKVPDEIYQIPPTSPVYNATYVKIYSVNPQTNEVVTGYTAGYLGAVITGGSLVWGTGYYYPPYYYMAGPYKPIYYPYYHTYGMGTYYSPYYGVYYRNGYAYGPYGGINGTSIYNPATGGYYHGVSAYGPYSAGRAFVAYNPTTGVHAAGYQRWTPYASWGRGVVSQGDQWAKGGYYSGPAISAAHVDTSGGKSASAVKVQGGDLYVGKDGNVYKKNADGNWESWQDGKWQPVDGNNTLQQNKGASSNLQNKQGATSPQDRQTTGFQNRQAGRRSSSQSLQDLNNESGARNRGNQNSSRYQSWQSGDRNPRSFSGNQNMLQGGGAGNQQRRMNTGGGGGWRR